MIIVLSVVLSRLCWLLCLDILIRFRVCNFRVILVSLLKLLMSCLDLLIVRIIIYRILVMIVFLFRCVGPLMIIRSRLVLINLILVLMRFLILVRVDLSFLLIILVLWLRMLIMLFVRVVILKFGVGG